MLRKKGKKQRKVSRMNSLPLYPISTFPADCKILLGAEREGSVGSRCCAVALGTLSPARPRAPPRDSPSFGLCSSRVWVT